VCVFYTANAVDVKALTSFKDSWRKVYTMHTKLLLTPCSKGAMQDKRT